MTTNNLRNKLERLKGRKMELEDSIVDLRGKIRSTKHQLELLEKAREIIRMVGLMTQQELQYHVSDITSLALESVFREPYKLLLEFVERRNKTECDIVFERDGERFNPIDSAGGGVIDVASFALRIASWSMSIADKRHVIILDEPMRFVSAEYQESVSAMIKEISQKLGIQFIIVTHNTTLASYADRTFEVKIRKGVSQVKES